LPVGTESLVVRQLSLSSALQEVEFEFSGPSRFSKRLSEENIRRVAHVDSCHARLDVIFSAFASGPRCWKAITVQLQALWKIVSGLSISTLLVISAAGAICVMLAPWDQNKTIDVIQNSGEWLEGSLMPGLVIPLTPACLCSAVGEMCAGGSAGG
jgi:hypothetical protein